MTKAHGSSCALTVCSALPAQDQRGKIRRMAGALRLRCQKSGVWRRGQTAVEYLLVTAALTVTFAIIYRVLQWYLARQFRQGGVTILTMYKELSW